MSQEEEISEAFDDRPKKNLTRHEIWWVERYQKLETAGYKLRPRYDPDWRPSWGNKKRWFGWIRGEKQWFDYEDGLIQSVGYDIYDPRCFFLNIFSGKFVHGCNSDL
jgi:hypothetical protein